MHDHDVRVRRHLLKRVRDRILPPHAAGDDPQRLGGAAQVIGRIDGEVGRQGDNDFVDRGMGEERRHASLENRSAPDRQQLFGARAAKPVTAAAGRKDG